MGMREDTPIRYVEYDERTMTPGHKLFSARIAWDYGSVDWEGWMSPFDGWDLDEFTKQLDALEKFRDQLEDWAERPSDGSWTYCMITEEMLYTVWGETLFVPPRSIPDYVRPEVISGVGFVLHKRVGKAW